MGVFQMQPALTAGGKPVYKNSEGQYVYYWPAHLDWRIGSDVTDATAGVRSTSNTDTLCPQDSSGWEEWVDESWVKSSVAVLAGMPPHLNAHTRDPACALSQPPALRSEMR